MAAMSAPAEKGLSPAPVTTSARTPPSRLSSRMARASSRSVAASRAFSARGRSRVSVATAPARVRRRFWSWRSPIQRPSINQRPRGRQQPRRKRRWRVCGAGPAPNGPIPALVHQRQVRYTVCMSKMVAIRLDEGLLVRVDRERRRRRITRARAVHEALADWVARHRLAEAVREEAEAYARQPVAEDEFGPVLGAQRWPK